MKAEAELGVKERKLGTAEGKGERASEKDVMRESERQREER